MKRKTMLILVFSSVTVATVALAARSLRGDKEETINTMDDETPKPADDKPAVVKTMMVKTSDLVETVTATGVTSPIREVTFSA